MKIFDNTQLKLAILYCLEKTGSKNLWKEVKKITKKPSFFHFVYLVCQIKKSGLYPEMKIQVKIKRSNKFYNILFSHIIKYDYKIENNRVPITNEKFSQVIKRWKISKKLIKQFKQKYNLDNKKIKIEQNMKLENDTYDDYLLAYTLAFIFITYLQIILLYFVSF